MNEKQLEAVKSLNNTLVIAGAGSGKTFTIINKINYLIDNKYYKEDEILVISFTNESVNDIKKKIKYNVDIKTFHKLGLEILKNENIHIAPFNLLNFIIDEYFNSYGKDNKKINKRIKRILIESSTVELKTLISTFINLYKANYTNINYLFKLYQKSHFINKDYLRIILEIYHIYQTELESAGYIDFNDMIIDATKNIKENKAKIKYKIIIIDEFQDTSLIRFNLIDAILKQNNGILFAVGDDYQSIYRFSGCNLDIFLSLKNYIPDLKIINLDCNYRNNQTLINIANNFIMKNKKQIKKNTICYKDESKPIKIYFYKNKSVALKRLIDTIDGNITILGRNNNDKKVFNIQENERIKYLTIHSSKGLEDDNIILINLENKVTSLPTKIRNHKILDLIIEKDKYPFEEERRLFYVALTRTKNSIYLLIPYSNYSTFVKEIIKDYKKYLEIHKY